MRKSILMFSFLLLFACSGDDASVATTDGQGGSLAVFALKNNYLYTVDDRKLHVFSLIDPVAPVEVNVVPIGFAIETLYSFGEYLFMGSQFGMYIYSIQNPENPVYQSDVQHVTACDPVVANATHSFVTLHSTRFCGNNNNLLEVYNTEDVQNPILVHSRNLTQPKGLGLYNDKLIVCDDVIKIFDITNPEEPVLVHHLPYYCFDVIIQGDILWGIGSAGLYRFNLNVQNITATSLVSTLNF
jgi:hypothetical protein